MTLRRVLIGAGILLVLALFIVLALLVGIVIGRGGQEEEAKKQPVEEKDENKTETTSDTNQKQNAPSKTIPPQSMVVGLGETGELSDRNVTVNDVQAVIDILLTSRVPDRATNSS